MCGSLDGEERLGRFAQEIVDHAPGDVLNIERPLAQIGIVDLAERLRHNGSATSWKTNSTLQ